MLPKPIWLENGKVFLIDQTKLPGELCQLEITTAEQMWDAIKRLVVRGAPAIGLAAAFGVWLGAARRLEAGTLTVDNFTTAVEEIGAYLDTARPTAVNLHWAVTRMHDVAVLQRAAAKDGTTAAELVQGLYLECQRMLEEDIAACRAIGEYGADLLQCRSVGDQYVWHRIGACLYFAGTAAAHSGLFRRNATFVAGCAAYRVGAEPKRDSGDDYLR